MARSPQKNPIGVVLTHFACVGAAANEVVMT